MKLGKNSIQGIFKYSETCVPEVNDFVLYDNYLWVAKCDSPGHAPSLEYPEEWSPYLSPTMATIDEVMEVLESDSSQWPEKAIPGSMLFEILDSVFHGLTGKGVIKDGIMTIDNILQDTSHPYGIYPIHRDNSEIFGLVDQDYDAPVFLKKYTYKSTVSGTDLGTHILLELYDYITGTMWVKLHSLTDPSLNTTGWKIVSPGEDIKGLIEKIIVNCRNKVKSIELFKTRLSDSFRYTRLTFPTDITSGRTIRVDSNCSKSNGSETDIPSLPGGSKLDYTVVVLLKSTETQICSSGSLTIPGNSSRDVYLSLPGLPDPVIVSMTLDQEAGLLTFSLQGVPSEYSGSIESIYYQDFFEDYE